MNCKDWNPHIALYVGGEIEAEMVDRIERHLAECEGCRGFAQELQQCQAEFRQLRNEPLEVTSLDRVRANVLSRVRTLEERRTWLDRFGFRWRFAALGCAALVVLSLFGWRLATRVVPVHPLIDVVEAPPMARSVEPAPPDPVAVPKAKRRVRSAVPTEAPKVEVVAAAVEPPPKPDTVIRIFTDDPSIVIYWLVEDKGGK